MAEVKTSKKVVVRLNHPYSVYFDMPDGRRVKVNGSNEELRGAGGVVVPGAFGETILDREDWESISAKYGNMTIFEKGYIFAANDKASANDQAREKRELRNGLEPVDVRKTKSKKG